jgi:hypothetical protein
VGKKERNAYMHISVCREACMCCQNHILTNQGSDLPSGLYRLALL